MSDVSLNSLDRLALGQEAKGQAKSLGQLKPDTETRYRRVSKRSCFPGSRFIAGLKISWAPSPLKSVIIFRAWRIIDRLKVETKGSISVPMKGGDYPIYRCLIISLFLSGSSPYWSVLGVSHSVAYPCLFFINGGFQSMGVPLSSMLFSDFPL